MNKYFLKKITRKYRAPLVILRKIYLEYKLQVFILVGLGLISGLLGGLSVGVLIPLVSFIFTRDQQGESDFISYIIAKAFNFLHLDPSIYLFIAIIVTLFILKAISLFIFGYVTNKISTNFEERAMKDIYSATLAANWTLLSKQKLGYLYNILMSHLKFLPRIMTSISNSFLQLINFLVYLVIAMRLSWTLTSSMLFFGGITLLVIRPILSRTKIYSQEQNSLAHAISHEVNENILGLKVLKSLGVEDLVSEKGFNLFAKLQRNKIKLYLLGSINSLAVEPIGIILIFSFFIYLYRGPDFNIATFGVIIYLLQKIFSYVSTAQTALNRASAASPYIEELYKFENQLKKYREVDSGIDLFNFSKSLVFDEVTFSYDLKEKAISKMSFRVEPGEMIGIIGPSGSGKSTLTDLMLRLIRPSSGKILLDGVQVERIDMNSWRKNVGYVSQDIFLKNDTIRNNIRFYDKSVTDFDIEEASRAANIYDLIMNLPNKFDTLVGERGVRFSGGERQRIALARVLARKPKILVLDEATSSLDSESEAIIKKAILAIKGSVTIIAIAHRLSTILDSDRIFVIQDGKIIENKDPKSLLSDKKSYLSRVAGVGNI